MVHFLRNDDNRTIIECEVTSKDLSSAINLGEYSQMLLSINDEDKNKFINNFSTLDELRGLWWENFEWTGDYKTIDDFVKSFYVKVAENWKLNYITD